MLVEYNGMAVGNTPFIAKAFDPAGVAVLEILQGSRSDRDLARRLKPLQAEIERESFSYVAQFEPRFGVVASPVMLRRFRIMTRLLLCLSAAVIARSVLGARAPLVATRRVDFPVRSALSRQKYHRASQIVAVSQAIARVLEADGFAPEDVRVVHEGVPDRPAEPGGREALEALGVPAGARVVGNVAALTDHKDHETLLRAFALLRAQRPARLQPAGRSKRGSGSRRCGRPRSPKRPRAWPVRCWR